MCGLEGGRRCDGAGSVPVGTRLLHAPGMPHAAPLHFAESSWRRNRCAASPSSRRQSSSWRPVWPRATCRALRWRQMSWPTRSTRCGHCRRTPRSATGSAFAGRPCVARRQMCLCAPPPLPADAAVVFPQEVVSRVLPLTGLGSLLERAAAQAPSLKVGEGWSVCPQRQLTAACRGVTSVPSPPLFAAGGLRTGSTGQAVRHAAAG